MGVVSRLSTAIRAPQRMPLLHVAKSAVATIGAWLLAGWLIAGPPPVFAAIAALLVVQPSVNQSLLKAVERSVGVVAGVVVASLLALVLGGAAWVVLVAVAVALLLAWATRMTPGTANQAAISAVLVLALGASTPDYALDRIVETLLGAAIGFVVNVAIVPPVAIAPARDATRALGEELAATLDRLGVALTRPQRPESLVELLVSARLLRPMLAAAQARIDAGAESLALNPRGGRHRAELERLRASVDLFQPVLTQTIGMTRAFADLYRPGIDTEPAVQAIAEELRRAALDVRRLSAANLGAAPADTGPAALTSPVTVAAPSPEHWILIGSLLVDLRRIHDALGTG